jgi:hypothetical protein
VAAPDRPASEGVYRLKTGLLQDGYLTRWVLVSLVLLALSLLAWGLRIARAGRPAPTG